MTHRMKTLKRDEIYANDYVDLDHLRRNIEAFITRPPDDSQHESAGESVRQCKL